METDIIIPIYNAFQYLADCINSVIRHTDLQKHTLLLINDKSTDPKVLPLLESVVAQHKGLNIHLINNPQNMGFVRTVNTGMQYSEHDVVLLNSDTEVTERWLDKIQHCAYSKPCVATVTPLSNNATLASVPDFLIENTLPEEANLDEYAQIVEKCSMKLYPEIPTANGFCMYIKREAIKLIGLFDAQRFGKGYGEENDFCYRCLQAGFRHLLCDDTYIYHKGSQSFSKEKTLLSEEHLKILKEMYPENYLNTDLFLQKNPIFPIQANVRYAYEIYKRPNILAVVHIYQNPPIGSIGGVTMHVYDLVKELVGSYNFHVLYYSEADKAYFVTSHFPNQAITNYIGKCPRYTTFNLYNDTFRRYVQTIVETLHINIIHIHHLLHFYLDIFNVAKEKHIPVIYSLHDYYALCPSINLINADKQPCNFPQYRNCTECIKRKYKIECNFIPLWQKEFHSCLSLAKKIIAPSISTQHIYKDFYGDLQIDIIEHGYGIRKKEHLIPGRKHEDRTFHIAFIGGISEIKGLAYLKGMINMARGSDIIVHLFGTTKDLMVNVNSKNFIYHGEYDRAELPNLLLKNDIKIICLLSICAETFSYTLSESLLLGIPVITLDIGAVAERVRKLNAGWIMPYGSSVEEIFHKIVEIKSDYTLNYAPKAANAKKYISEAKDIPQMAHEYAAIYDQLLSESPIIHSAQEYIQAKLDFFQNLKNPLLINDSNVFSIRVEYTRLKNMVIKGDAPLSLAIQEVKKFRSLAQGTKYRNKILFKLIWYRGLQHHVLRVAANLSRWLKK